MSNKLYNINELMEGLDVAYNAVAHTLGPIGSNTIIDFPHMLPLVTNDGYTILKGLSLANPVANAGLKLIRDASLNTNRKVGDGTTTACILTYHLTKAGVTSTCNSVLVTEGIRDAAKLIISKLPTYSKPISDKDIDSITNIATISSGSKDLGAMVAKAIVNSNNGYISTVTSYSGDDYVSTVEGFGFGGTLYVHGMANSLNGTFHDQDTHIFLCSREINNIETFTGFLHEYSRKFNTNKLVIVADQVSTDILMGVFQLMQNGQFNATFIKAPGIGKTKDDIFKDLAAALDIDNYIASYDTESSYDIKNIRKINSIKITNDETIIEFDKNVYKNKRSSQRAQELLEEKIALRAEDSVKHRKAIDELDKRINSLNNNIVTISCTGNNDMELNDKKLRIEDAIAAVKASLLAGVSVGGGVTMLRLSKLLEREIMIMNKDNHDEEYIMGYTILANALKEPFRQITLNSVVGNSRLEKDFMDTDATQSGYDFKTRRKVDDAYTAGIIDPTLVIKTAIENAVGTACMIITSNLLITDDIQPCNGEEVKKK